MNVLEIAKDRVLSEESMEENPNVTITEGGHIIHE